MSHKNRNAVRAVSVLLIIVLFQVYVLADATRPNTGATNGSAPAGMIFGKLNLPGNRVILVNGNSAATGTTIFSGAELQTPEGVEANVQLGAAGHLEIAPSSKLTLTFDRTNVDVRVTAGSAVLSTNAGVAGSVTTAEGKVERSNPANASSVVGGKPAPAPPGLSKEEKAALIIIPAIIALIIIIVVANNDDDNESPSSPNRQT